MATRFCFSLADGQTIEGFVQGAGGLITGRDALDRVLLNQRRAGEGRAFVAMYEPQPGHVSVRERQDAESIAVPLIGTLVSTCGAGL